MVAVKGRALLWATGAVALLLAAAVVWVQPTPDPPRPAAAVAGVSTEAVLCDALNREAHVMADGLKREFHRHHQAHRDYRAGKIPFGPKEKPGTVLWIWNDTLAKGARHAHHYEELRSIMRAKGCLAPV